MRLRRETGDFQIKVTSGVVNTIRKGLRAEDLIGECVLVDGTFEVVTSASDDATNSETEAVTASYTLTYAWGTGAITAVENS